MRHKPSGFVSDAKRAMQLMSAKALLAAAEETEGQQPLIESDFAVLEDRADSHREGFGALVALVDAGAGGLALELRDAISVIIAAMRADRTVRPMQRFKVLPSLVRVAVNRVGNVGHGHVPVYAETLRLGL